MQIPIFWDIGLDYLRAISYAIVFLTDLRGIKTRKFGNILYVGDAVLAFSLFLTAFNMGMSVFDLRGFVDIVVTPAVLIWATLHFYDFLKKA